MTDAAALPPLRSFTPAAAGGESRPGEYLAGIIRARGIFGCGSLHHLRTIRRRRHLLEAAYRAGFRQFDVAPAYGNGLAERAVGAFAAEVGADVQVCTKAGIPVTIYSRWTDAVFPVARLWDTLFGNHRRVYSWRNFAPETLVRSLAESTTRLHGRAPQGFYLHEPLQPFPYAQWCKLVGTLERLHVDGHFGFWGIAGPRSAFRRWSPAPVPPYAVQCPVADWLGAAPADRTSAGRVSLYGLVRYHLQSQPKTAFEDWLCSLAAEYQNAYFVLTTRRPQRLAAWGGP